MTFHGFIQKYEISHTVHSEKGISRNDIIQNLMYHFPPMHTLCTAGLDLTLTDCLVSSLELIGANFNELMRQRTINVSNSA